MADDPVVTIASTTETQEELEHAAGKDWRTPFTPPAEMEVKPGAPVKGAEVVPAKGADQAGAGEGKSEDDKEISKEEGYEGLPKGVVKRLKKLTAQARTAQDELAELREQISEGRREPGEEREEPRVADPNDPEPKEEDEQFRDEPYTAFLRAHAAWTYRQERNSELAAETRASEEARSKEVYDAHLGRIEAAKAEHADFEDSVKAVGALTMQSPQANMAFQLAVIESENGPEMIRHLASHPEEFKAFAGYSPTRVQMELGRLSASLLPSRPAGAAPKGKAVSKAPEPVTPLSSSTASQPTRIDDPKITADEFIRLRNQQERDKRRRA